MGLPDDAGFTPLHFAAQAQQAVAIQILLDASASVDARDSFGRTPLWVALMNVRDGDGAAVRRSSRPALMWTSITTSGSARGSSRETVANYDLKRSLR